MPMVMELISRNLNSEHPPLVQGSLDEFLKGRNVEREASPGRVGVHL